MAQIDLQRDSQRELQRLHRAWGYSREGLLAAWRSSPAFRLEALLALVLLPTSFAFPASGAGHALMIFSVLLVLLVELVNSATEAAVDRISTEIHPLAKQAKDMASAAVFVALVNVPVVWFCVLCLS